MAEDDKLSTLDATLLRRAFALAGEARARGDRPFAAVIADETGKVLAEAGSTQGKGGGGTLAHSEMNVLHAVLRAGLPRGVLRAATIYSSGEPCAMCSAAIFYTGVGRGFPPAPFCICAMRSPIRRGYPFPAAPFWTVLLNAWM